VFWEWHKDEQGNMHKIYFTSVDSLMTIEFPWTNPEHPEYVFSPTEEFPDEQV
jgi:hypothetical protein